MKIVVDYEEKTRKLTMSVPFLMADIARGFPSRKFDPKSKLWKMPLVRPNMAELDRCRRIHDITVTPAAQKVIDNFETASAAPKREPFPAWIYDFTKSKSGFSPMKHQSRMLDGAWGMKAHAWFAKMGTGKTFAAVHLAFARHAANQIDAVMIISPSTLRPTWGKELAKYATAPYEFKIHESAAGWLKEFYAPGNPNGLKILAVSVEGLGVSEKMFDSACGFMVNRRVMVIMDESSRIKNPKALRTARAIQIGNCAEYRMILNGTPIALGIQDLWSQYEFLDPNIIDSGDFYAFKARYVESGGFEGKQIIGYKNVEELMTLIHPYTTEVGKDVLELPPKVMKDMICQATKEQKALFKLIIKGPTGDKDEPLIKVTNALEKHLRLQQVVGGWLPKARIEYVEVEGEQIEVIHTDLIPLKENPKMDLLKTIIGDNMVGNKFLIWTRQVHEIEAIRDILVEEYGEQAVATYYGKTDKETRPIVEDRYCTDPTLRFVIANPQTAGLGLTFISGENDVMIYYTGTNAYIDRAQSEDRSHRKGQMNTVLVMDLIMERTIDEAIKESIEAKMDMDEYIMTRMAAGANLYDSMLG